eukprot:31074-Pelagococcus_subviridis.AAC.14
MNENTAIHAFALRMYQVAIEDAPAGVRSPFNGRRRGVTTYGAAQAPQYTMYPHRPHHSYARDAMTTPTESIHTALYLMMNISAWCFDGFSFASAKNRAFASTNRSVPSPRPLLMRTARVSVVDSAKSTANSVRKIFPIVIHMGGMDAMSETGGAGRPIATAVRAVRGEGVDGRARNCGWHCTSVSST